MMKNRDRYGNPIPTKGQAIGWGVLALLPLTFALFFIIGGLKAEDTRQEKLSVLNHGERTTGTIISSKVFPEREGDSLIVKYVFTPSSGEQLFGTYSFRDTFGKHFWDDFHVGDRIDIAYNQQNPAINLPVNAEPQEKDNFALWFGIIISSLGAGFVTFWLGKKAWESW